MQLKYKISITVWKVQALLRKKIDMCKFAHFPNGLRFQSTFVSGKRLVLRSSSVRFPYLSVRRPFFSVLIRCISVLSVTFPLLVRRGPLRVRCLSGRSPVLVRYVSVPYFSREPRAAAASTFTNGRPTDKGFLAAFSSVRRPFALSG